MIHPPTVALRSSLTVYSTQINGKVERFNRTLVDEFAYARLYTSNSARLDALPRWVAYYNKNRRHAGPDGHAPLEPSTTSVGRTPSPVSAGHC